MTPEGKVQTAIQKAVKAAGGLVRKMAWEGRAGAPDLCVMLNGRVVFVEVKKPGGKPEARQVREHARMRKRGADVRVIDNIADGEKLVAELVAVDYTHPVPVTKRTKK